MMEFEKSNTIWILYSRKVDLRLAGIAPLHLGFVTWTKGKSIINPYKLTTQVIVIQKSMFFFFRIEAPQKIKYHITETYSED